MWVNVFVESGLKSTQGHLIITAIETQIQLLPSPFTVLRCVSRISSLFLSSFYWFLSVYKWKIKLIRKRSIKCIHRGKEPGRRGSWQDWGNCYVLSFPPFLFSPVPGNRMEKEAIFLFYMHTYSIIYIYITIYRTKKLSFQWNICFFNNQLVFKCDRNYNVQLLQGFWRRGGREKLLWGFCSAFPSGFYFWLFFLVSHLC